MASRRSRIATLNKYNMGGPFNSWEIRSDRYFNSFTANGGIPTELRNRLRWDCHDLLRSIGQRYGARRELVQRMLRNCNDFLRLRGFNV